MDSQTGTASVIKHKKKTHFFVEIPRSPFLLKHAITNKLDSLPASLLHKGCKENTVPLSLKTVMINAPNEKKRKTTDYHEGVQLPGAKKFKPTNGDGMEIACHQCRSKKIFKVVLQCTRISQETGIRCKASYCHTCLRNRYGEDIEILRQTKPTTENEKVLDYAFNCPRCEGHCNCAPCRKKQGLPPVGKFSYIAGQASVREILQENPQALGRLPNDKLARIAAESNVFECSEKVNADQVRKKQVTKARPVRVIKYPEPVWVPILSTGSKEDIEARIFLREFVLRFNPILNISVRNLDELEDFLTLRDTSTKAVLISLLELIAIEDSSHKKTILATVKIIRSLGLNWGKIVLALYDLRDGLPSKHPLRNLPAALNASDVETSYNTRGSRLQGVHADQVLPILLFLIDTTLEGDSVREELEEGTKQAKEVRMVYYKAMRKETDRWAVQRAKLQEERSNGDTEKVKGKSNPWKFKYRHAERAHKDAVSTLRHFHRAEMDACSSRFMPLGCDIDGRTYYILSASGPHKGKKDRIPCEAERSGMRRWGWFVAVFGKPGTRIAGMNSGDIEGDSEENDSGDPNTDRWWGFWSVEDIRKLSNWLARRVEIEPSKDEPADSACLSRSSAALSEQEDDEQISTSRAGTLSGMKFLAKSIMEFADFVEWRLKRESNEVKI